MSAYRTAAKAEPPDVCIRRTVRWQVLGLRVAVLNAEGDHGLDAAPFHELHASIGQLSAGIYWSPGGLPLLGVVWRRRRRWVSSWRPGWIDEMDRMHEERFEWEVAQSQPPDVPLPIEAAS